MYPRTTATYRSLPRFRKVLDTPPTTSYASDYMLRLLVQVTPPPTTSYASYYKLRLRLAGRRQTQLVFFLELVDAMRSSGS